ncbi:uncharacterized protein PHACADRAFT_202364 [Phanerochaete carnosa HHB-10118-sp]|uniref:Uncharacterized protein n=1 Tax=Phanerochaete carnosa (strain HHB-10118-sp) TaxID=650164 RepID=K5WF93_PHACS|nr:uncharacterized protein PHACADRAFT_202364 [Phanerochaete carnosa HHB-10118-sp]EKM48812.1 hypothetical protein PHACADRAFT_202364 [Phanerochaete carnosa HHB-10118-sp]
MLEAPYWYCIDCEVAAGFSETENSHDAQVSAADEAGEGGQNSSQSSVDCLRGASSSYPDDTDNQDAETFETIKMGDTLLAMTGEQDRGADSKEEDTASSMKAGGGNALGRTETEDGDESAPAQTRVAHTFNHHLVLYQRAPIEPTETTSDIPITETFLKVQDHISSFESRLQARLSSFDGLACAHARSRYGQMWMAGLQATDKLIEVWLCWSFHHSLTIIKSNTASQAK